MTAKRKQPADEGRYKCNLLILGDTHIGSDGGLCPPQGFRRDSGVRMPQNRGQQFSWAAWEEAKAWVRQVIKDEPFDALLGGDLVDGMHHNSTTEMSDNINDQESAAVEILAPMIEGADRVFGIRGTEAHVGQAGQSDERICRALGCVPDDDGRYARYDLWYRLGRKDGPLVHDLHHIGTVGTQAYESTAPMREYAEACIEAARMGMQPPDVIVRHHRHRGLDVKIPTVRGQALVFTVQGWQLKDSAFTWRATGVRQAVPQLGLTVLQFSEEAGPWTRHFTRFGKRSREV